MFPWEIFNSGRIADSTAGSAGQVLTGVLLLRLWNEQQAKQPATPGPQVNVQEAESKQNVPVQQMKKRVTVNKQASHLGTCREQYVALLLPSSVPVSIWEHQERSQICQVIDLLHFFYAPWTSTKHDNHHKYCIMNIIYVHIIFYNHSVRCLFIHTVLYWKWDDERQDKLLYMGKDKDKPKNII